MYKIYEMILIVSVFLMIIQSVYAIENVQHSVDGNKITLSYQGTPPFLINIRPDTNMGQTGGYLWAETYSNSFSYDMSFAVDSSKTFYYGIKDASWSTTNSFDLGQHQSGCQLSADNSNGCCKELINNHNNPEADRINIVFVLLDFPNEEYVIDWVKDNLGFDNGTRIFHINPHDYFSEKENGWIHVNESNTLDFTMFALEPLKSNKDKFNFWYYSLNTNYNQSRIDDFLEETLDPTKQSLSLCGQKYVTGIIIQAFPLDNPNYFRQGATLPSFANSLTIDKDSIKFGVFYDSYGINSSGVMLSGFNEPTSYLWMHESAHSIFGLLDEYSTVYENPRFGYPNCARTLSEASTWWRDFENVTDDNYYYLNQLENDFYASNPNINIKRSMLCTSEDVKTGYVFGGCGTYLDSGDAIRPSRDSFMVRASSCPVPGMVNRHRMESVLNLFSGK